MSQRTCIAAYTVPPDGKGFPAYLCFTKVEDGSVEVVLRAPASDDGKCGESVQATFKAEAWATLAREIAASR